MSSVPVDTAFVHLTKACNLRCAYCYFSASNPLPGELSAAEYAALWPDFVAVRPEKIVFTGGEPLLRDDLFDILAALRDAEGSHVIRRCLNTNGHLLTAPVARRLADLVDEVRLSLDAMRERNDALRGGGNHDAVLRAIDLCHGAGLQLKVLVTVTSETLPDLDELMATLLERGVRRIKLNAFRPIGRGMGRGHWRVSAAELRAAAHRAWTRVVPAAAEPAVVPEDDCQITCGVGRFLNVMPDGDVFPCHVLTDAAFRCGNLRQESLVAICSRERRLGRLAALDFRALASDDARLAPLTRRGACMGDVLADLRNEKAAPAGGLPSFLSGV
jgi:MoaA/NifB/PqqE/SkfB family radical SAM enzyme